MKQLGTLDSAFINLEHANTPQHIGGFGIYDPSTAPGGFVRFKQVIANFEQRLQKMPIMRTRLVEVPLGLDKPYWVIDDNFDTEFHLRHIALPKPGDWRQLCIQAARLHSRPLDMSRPLWECYIIEGLDKIPGLPEGAFAIYTKMHHSLIDGAGSQSFMQALHDLEPIPPSTPDEDATDEEKEYAPTTITPAKLLRKAAINNVSSSVGLVKGTVKLAGGLIRTALDIRSEKLPAYPSTPKSRFDEPVGPHRVFDASLFSLDDFKAMRRATGTTINDVAVTVVAGALREYLQHHDELPDEPLAASMPVNIRGKNEQTEDNNQIAAIMSLIHTDIEEPVDRLQAISRSMTGAKKFVDTPLADPIKVAGIFNPWLSKRVASWYVDRRMTEKLPMGNCCGVITNVMGPSFPLYSAGAQLVQYYPMGVLTAGGGLFHSVFSMAGTLSISAIADREAMPDPEFYRQCLDNSYKALKESVAERYKVEKPVKKNASVKKKAPGKKKASVKKRAAAKKAPAKKKSRLKK
jgi:diacylglycerol O-acyltransferase / wax synthase